VSSSHLPVKVIAEELAISVDQAKKLITEGVLPAVNIGVGRRTFWRVSREDFDAYLAKERAATARRFGAAS
jgi:excisionase family DNA binding protein